MSDEHRQQRRREERAQGGVQLPPPPPSVASADAGTMDTETVELVVKLSQLGAIAIARAGDAITRSQSMIPDFSDGPPEHIPTLATAVLEQARAFRFSACAAHIDKAIQELKRPLDVPIEAESPTDDG